LKDISNALKHSTYITESDAREISTFLNPLVTETRFGKHQQLISENDQVGEIYLIAEGKVEVQSISDDRKLIVEVARAGDIIGLEAVITGTPSQLTVKALEPVRVFVVQANDIRFLLDHNQHFTKNVLKIIGDKLEHAWKQMAENCYQPARQRVASAILYLQGIYSKSENEYFDGNRSIIARLTGIRRETATKIVRMLEEEALIKLNDESMAVLDQNTLLGVKELYS